MHLLSLLYHTLYIPAVLSMPVSDIWTSDNMCIMFILVDDFILIGLICSLWSWLTKTLHFLSQIKSVSLLNHHMVVHVFEIQINIKFTSQNNIFWQASRMTPVYCSYSEVQKLKRVLFSSFCLLEIFLHCFDCIEPLTWHIVEFKAISFFYIRERQAKTKCMDVSWVHNN